jgi:hypothetical protein
MGDPGFRQLAVRDFDIVVPYALNLSLPKQYWFCGKVSNAAERSMPGGVS